MVEFFISIILNRGVMCMVVLVGLVIAKALPTQRWGAILIGPSKSG